MDQKTSALIDINRRLTTLFARAGETTLASVPDGMAGKALADLVSATGTQRLLFVARDGQRLASIIAFCMACSDASFACFSY